MTALPTPQHTTAQAILGWWERNADDGHRAHLGASLIGHPCERHLWYALRWVRRASFDGRILRLFNTGKREEPRVIDELRGIGCEVWADDGSGQYRVSTHGGHFGGSMDGVVRGLPEAPKAPHVLEIKTHSAKSFKDLCAKRVQAAKPQHWAQMQAYMHLADLDRALYFAVNKDTDDLYIERVEYDKPAAEALMAKALRIIEAGEPPLRISDDPAWFECKFCSFHPVCHGQALPEVNCRTCAHSTPDTRREGGTWTCSAGTGRALCTLPVAHQRTGCDSHRFIPILLAQVAEPIDSDGDAVTYRTPDGREFTNGPRPGFASAEIVAGGIKAVTSQQTLALCESFPTARVVPA